MFYLENIDANTDEVEQVLHLAKSCQVACGENNELALVVFEICRRMILKDEYEKEEIRKKFVEEITSHMY